MSKSQAGQEVEVRRFGWEPSPRLAELAARTHPDEILSPDAARLVFLGMSPNTLATYAYQWRKFVRWCGHVGRAHEPGLCTTETCIEYMNELWRTEGRYGRPTAPETVKLALKVIAVVHNRARRPETDPHGRPLFGYVSPTTHPDVKLARKGYTTQWLDAGHRPDTAYPLNPDEMAEMVATIDVRTVMGRCDVAMLSIGYDLGARRVELANLNVGDIEFHIADPENVTTDDWVGIHIARSKTDDSGEGELIPLKAHGPADASTCPVRNAWAWFQILRSMDSIAVTLPFLRVVRTGGPQPLDGRPRAGKVTTKRIDGERVELVVRRAFQHSGLQVGARRMHVVPHSMRAGAATEAAANGADTAALNAHFRWARTGTTSQRYVRAGRRLAMNPVAAIWRNRDERRRAAEKEKG